MTQKVFLILIFLILLIPAIFAENCGSNVVLNTDCNIATQLIDNSNNPVITASCDANLYNPEGLPGFISNKPLHWNSGIYLIESDSNFSILGIWIFSIACTDGGNKYFGTTEFNIVLSDEETTDPNNCEIDFSANESKKTNALIFSASGFDSKRNSLGLSPTIDIFDLDSGLKTINQQTMTEQSEIPGLYTYYFTGAFMPSNYGILVSFDENCSKYGEFEVNVGEAFLEERQVKTALIGLSAASGFEEQLFAFPTLIILTFIPIAIIIFSLVAYNKWFKRRFAP